MKDKKCRSDTHCRCKDVPPTLVVVGCQWGDEGKGKIVDFLAGDHDIVVRYNGGNNAGHTVVIGDEKYKFHLIPSGSIQRKKVVIGSGMVVDPKVLLSEVKTLREKGLDPKLFVSDRAHVIMPYHRSIDASREKRRCGDRIGTTGRGIGPAYTDKVRRTEAIRMCDLVGPNLRERLSKVVCTKTAELIEHGIIKDENEADRYAEEVYSEYAKYADETRKYVTDTTAMINEDISRGRSVLFEGAQGTMLDIDHGTYPYVTTSSPVSGGVCTGAGIGPAKIGKVIGVAKAYTTRVGEGPFPTEIEDGTGERIRNKGGEFGTTTGRPRRCGWLDLVVLRHAATLNGLDGIVLTKVDVLSGMGKIMVCKAYDIDGEVTRNFPASAEDLERAKPVYVEFPGWEEFGSKDREDLPRNAMKYRRFIEKETGVPVTIVSNGQRRDQTILL